MRLQHFATVLCVSSLCISVATAQSQPPLSTDAIEVVESNNQFALDIYKRLLSKSDENLLVSPFSISTALAMTYAGARERTAEQMASTLRFTLPDERLHAAFGELIHRIVAPREGYQLRTANRLFGQTGYAFQQPFLNSTGTHYNAPLQDLNFAQDAENSRKTINQWVSGQTNDRIPELLASGTITEETRLVLTNAIYFNAKWKHQFAPESSRPQNFYGSGGSVSEVSMMFQQKSLRYAEKPGFQMLQLPYKGDDLAMVIMLPTERDGLPALQQSLTNELWKSSLNDLQDTLVNVALPKFTFDSSFGLSNVLKEMGMTDPFSGAADFSGIAAGEKLSISEVIHKSFIAVNEEGTEAAAATAVIVGVTSTYVPPTQPKNFLADHPFLFALQDLNSGELLFMGRVTDPSKLVAPVPEPTTATLIAIGGLLVAIAANRKRRVTN